jgi:hypothetical protein
MMILFSLFMALSSFAQAQDTQACPGVLERGGSIQMQMIQSSIGVCYISVNNFKNTSMVYRSYLFASTGELLVFNSYGDGPISDFTGAREVFTFPRKYKTPTYNWNPESRRLEVTTVTGDTLQFDYETAELVAWSSAEVAVDSEVKKDNNAGLSIKNYKGLLFDSGFNVGDAPTSSPNRKATFTDETGKTCALKVGDIFKYTDSGNPFVKYTDKELAGFLKKKCPKLKFPVP